MDGCGDPGLVGVDAALAALDAIAPLPVRRVPTTRALHCVLAQPAHAALDLPPFTRSAVDGYAVRHAELTGALPLAGEVRAAAQAGPPRHAPGTAQRIFTGGWLPLGADTVVRQEWTQVDDGRVMVRRQPGRGADVRLRGEEVLAGEPIAEAGLRLTAGLLAALCAAGVGEIGVRARPRVAVLVTGDEVAPPGRRCRPGQVPDACGPLIAAWLAEQGCDAARVEYVADTIEAVREALGRAFAGSDLVLTTGGVSVGDHDHVPRAARDLGARALFWKVAQKPGKPLLAALREGVPLLGLPGNPASVLVNLLVYARRALARLEGAAEAAPAFRTAVLEAAANADRGRDQWLRMALRYDEAGRAVLSRLPGQGSHMLGNLARAGALARIRPSAGPTPAGTVVRWVAL